MKTTGIQILVVFFISTHCGSLGKRGKVHTLGYNVQGFKEYKRISTRLDDITCELVVMRHYDDSKIFEQYDGLLSTYLKASCELCYYEVNLKSVK